MNKLSGKSYNLLLVALGIFASIALITGWLRSQYFKEVETLERQLKSSLFESTIEIRDSLLHEMIVSKSSDTLSVTIYSDSIEGLPKPPKPFDEISQRTNQYIFDLEDNGRPNPEGKYTRVSTIQVGDTSDLIMESLYLFIDQLNFGDSAKIFYPSSENAYSHLQSMLYKKLSPDYPRLEFEVIPTLTFEHTVHELIFEAPFLRKKAFFVIKNPFRAILNNLIWEIIIALLALIAISTALIVIYKQLQKWIAINNMRDAFVANVSHEISTPLSIIKVALESISKHQASHDTQLAQEYIQIAENELNRLAGMTNSIVQSKHLKEKSFQLEKSTYSLNKQLQEAIRITSIKVDPKFINISLNTEKEIEIVADEKLVMGIWINLLENAIKYSHEGEIEVEAKETPKEITVSVKDRGVGVPAAYHEKIFEQFFRVPTGNVHNVKGHGIGLFYCKEIVDIHKGKIQYHPREDGGSVFIVTIPKKNEL